MPNWCNNSILIEGPADKIRALWEQAQTVTAADGNEERGGLLSTLRPEPDYLAVGVDPAFPTVSGTMPDWWNWRVENWGTKWDVTVDDLHYKELPGGRACIAGSFESAWSPPIAAFDHYAQANPDCELELKYFEPGMSFIGVWDSLGGDAYWEGVGELVQSEADAEDATLDELFTEFNVWDWYEFEE